MRIAIAVHGRWDAFDLARELSNRGHNVTLLTNYPRWAVERFGVRGDSVRSFWPHGVLSRAMSRLGGPTLVRRYESKLHSLFGRWAAATLRGTRWDVLYIFSGVAEESLRALSNTSSLRMLVRESTHIRTQDRLLHEEELRTKTLQDRPSAWMIAREEREYVLADAIRVLSRFAYQTFVAESVPAWKVKLIASGIQVDAFRSSESQLDVRRRRVLSGAPLRVLNVGTFAFRKGVWDTATVIRTLGTDRFEYRFVGPVAAEAKPLASELQGRATFVPKQPQSKLPASYAWGDVFMLPTIEDGYAVVLAQAASAGLPLLTTPNGAGWDLVRDGQNGWVLPIRSPQAFVERLQWADRHRAELADMIGTTDALFPLRDSADVAADLERVCAEYAGTAVLRA